MQLENLSPQQAIELIYRTGMDIVFDANGTAEEVIKLEKKITLMHLRMWQENNRPYTLNFAIRAEALVLLSINDIKKKI